MTSRKFDRLFGGPPRLSEIPIAQRECDLAASIQKVTEIIILRMADRLHLQTGSKNLCLAGGVALNCVANGRLLRESPFEKIWIQPASGDAGGALGAALFVWYQLLENTRTPGEPDGQQGSFLGPAYATDVTENLLKGKGAVYRHFTDGVGLSGEVAKLISDGNVVGWMQGRMEFGPRALGARSILGDARNPEMQSLMNLKIKFRESFRPFAPIVLRARADEYFELGPENWRVRTCSSLSLPVLRGTQQRGRAKGRRYGDWTAILQARSVVPAITHVDNSARIQTVDRGRNPRLTRLLEAFADLTGCPVMINTSFNVRGEPIVLHLEEAYHCFMQQPTSMYW